MKLRLVCALLLAVSTLALTSCSTGSGNPGAGTIYLDYNVVSGSGTSYIFEPLIYQYAVSGGPPSLITGAETGTYMQFVAVDASGNIYTSFTSNSTGDSVISVFAPNSLVLTSPIRSFYSSAMTAPIVALTVDPSGYVYVVDQNNHLFKFSATASGLTTPLLTLSGLPTPGTGIATDAGGNLYLAMNEFISVNGHVSGNLIYVYNAGFTSSTPSRIITPPVVEYIDGLAVDQGGNLYASGELYFSPGTGRIDVYAPGASGSATPISTIAGSAADLAGNAAWLGYNYNTIAVDTANNIYVRSINYNGSTYTDIVNEFAPGSSGDVAPTATISTPLPNGDNIGIAVH